MTPMLSRRGFLASSAAVTATLAVGGLHPGGARAAQPIRLAVERRTIDVNGKPASVFAIRQADGTPGVFLDPGQRFAVELENRSGEETILHWHGQTPPVRQDGVAMTGLEPLIRNDASQGYDYVPRAGTYWMHSHQDLQEQLLMAAPLVVRTADDLRMDAQELTVLLHDFTFRDPADILASLTGESGTEGTSAMAGMDHMAMAMGGHSATRKPSTPGRPETGKTGAVMDLNDIDFDAYLANDRTLADPLVVRTERNGLVRLRLINGATSTAFWIDLGALEGTLLAVDGDGVQPLRVKRLPLAEAQRVDLLVRVPSGATAFPVLAQREGDRQRTGFMLAPPGARIAKVSGLAQMAAGPVDLSLERRLRTAQPLAPRRADVLRRVTLGGTMKPYVWRINGETWADHRPLMVAQGQRVVLEMVNQSPMAHPMHLHGHHFQVIALNGQPLNGAMRDTVLVPADGSVRVAFDADNPGRWLLHCHNLYHMMTGMITEVAYEGFA